VRLPAVQHDRPRVVFEDPDLPHQIVIRLARGTHLLAVSCNCLRRQQGHGEVHEPIETRHRWEASEAIAVWRKHLEEATAA
jgi:hypothetical protein